MRHYPKNSPRAAARFLLLAALADGDLDNFELAGMDRFPALRKLRLERALFAAVLDEFCQDAEASLPMVRDAWLELRPGEIARVLADIEQPELQRALCRAALSVIGADQRVHTGEALLLWAALDAWDLQLANILRSPKAALPRFALPDAARAQAAPHRPHRSSIPS